jgi:superfamily II DNA or RNA helicase
MVQTLNNMDLKGVETGLLVMDEVHTIPSKTAYSVCMKIKADYRLGLSATPTRSDGAEMKIFACCGTIAASISVEQLVEGGYLAAPVFRMENLSPVRLKYNESWHNVYKQGIVLNFERNERISQIAEEYLLKGRQVYIHVNQIDHGKCLTGMIEGAVFVCGSTKKSERADIIDRFKSGDIRCLVSTLLKEGVSIDGITCLIFACGGKSEVNLIQVVGRSLRVDPVFGDAIIVDFIERGHRILENHVQERINAYRETYGILFQY